MATVEERLASLEARMDRIDDLHALIVGLRADLTDWRGDMNRQFTEVRADTSRRFDAMNGQVTDLRSDMNQRLLALDVKVDRHFTWLVGIQVALMLAVIGAMVGAYYK
jgi:hypothetical protein